GSASIGGNTLGMTRFLVLGDVRGDILISSSQSLTLYFNDDPGAFGDNGYNNWDSGDAGDCDEGSGRTALSNDRYGGPAYVYISITHDTASPSATVGAPANGGTYGLGDQVNAQYSCSPSVSWVAVTGCSGSNSG